ncbi:MAG: guanosine polyphosphate pyrophosphohydrolase, partial [Lachnospiraceae bacterium]|nr:guanosine polyphosphate pyrophosphohydrolase [Candidatus Colinaster scatohippi]
MITLNDYLYSGDTVIKILHRYSEDLMTDAKQSLNQVDMAHANFLRQIISLLEHNDFLTSQSMRIREFYKIMALEYPFLAFTFKGRIKSLIRTEEKFNGYIVNYIYDYYIKNGVYPTVPQIKDRLSQFRDLVAYRIVISIPRCHLDSEENRRETELKYLYEIANRLPLFLEETGFSPEMTGLSGVKYAPELQPEVQPYYRDYIANKKELGYESLHITVFDNQARCHTELQLRTKEMDDYAEIGPANHLGYEKRQEAERARRQAIPKGECKYFDEAYERGMLLQQLDLSKVDVNMFAAADNFLINDGCGLYRGRQITP